MTENVSDLSEPKSGNEARAWDSESKKDDEEEKKTFNSGYEILVDYSEYSTIQGFIYIFFSYQTWFGRVFWILVIVLMTILGLYWCIKAYVDWQDKPVLTTITTTAFPVKSVTFPAVTICSPGLTESNLEAGFYKLFLGFLSNNNLTVPFVTAFNASAILKSNDSDPTVPTSVLTAKTKLNVMLKSSHYGTFLNESFPGLKPGDDVIGMIKLLVSKNPDADIAAIVALKGGFNPCVNSSATAGRKKRSTAADECDPGFVADDVNKFCYFASSYLMVEPDGFDFCKNLNPDAELLLFESDNQVVGLLNMIAGGQLVLPGDKHAKFFLQANRESDGNFYFNGVPVSQGFKNLTILPDPEGSFPSCLTGSLDTNPGRMSLTPTDCYAPSAIICRKIIIVDTPCTAQTTFVKKNTFDLLLDPKLKTEKDVAVARKKKEFKDIMLRLDQTKSYKAIFSNLWYATLPCFDVKGVTAEKNGDKAVLKYCEWKGKAIPCAAIFTTFPTDRGMCCSFNMEAADNIFKGEEYPQLVKKLQESDKNSSFTDSTIPKYFVDGKEPKTLPGRNKGLVLIVDAHSDQFASGSVDSDFEGFMGFVGSNGTFPLLSLEGFEIIPGHNNIVSLTASKIDAEEELKNLDESQRRCRFADENSNMTIHKNYTYSNCILECGLLYAQSKLDEEGLSSCIPWYFPSSSDDITLCDPWESIKFLNYMITNISDEQCAHCLPDCSITIYEPAVFAVPFRRCDSSNLGVSRFCNLNNKDLPQPTKYGSQVLDEYEQRNKTGTFLNSIQRSTRYYGDALPEGDVFTLNPAPYDAYEKDIAMVQIFFDKSTVFQMGSQPRMTWIDYLSTVGGLLGLVLGMGIVSFIELIWLCLRVGAQRWNLTEWVH